MPKRAEALVMGAGPGGYVAAVRLGQLGKETILVEREWLGGVCLNVGCIPSKALIHLAKLKKKLEELRGIGIEASSLKVDLGKVQKWKDEVIERLRSGIGTLCKGNNVEVIHGEARFLRPNEVKVKTANGSESVEARNIIIATGSRPIELPGFKFDGERIITSTEALELTEVPKNLVVVGGGVTGLEIGTMYAHLGSKVTVIEIMDQLLPGTDLDLVRVVHRNLRKFGVEVHLKSRAKAYEDGKVIAQLPDGKEIAIEADKVLVTVGRKPNTDNIGLESTGVETDAKGFIKVNKQMQTNVPGIYAIGDVVGPPMLAHKASKEGIVAAEVIAGHPSTADFKAIPNVIFTDPEIASAGLTEDQAEERGYEPLVGKFPFLALGRALITGEADGFVKIVADKRTGLILGVHIVGAGAADLISEGVLAIEMGATIEDLALTIHPHPTLPEAIMEAAEVSKGTPIHILRGQ